VLSSVSPIVALRAIVVACYFEHVQTSLLAIVVVGVLFSSRVVFSFAAR
jgi:hypothetical protein